MRRMRILILERSERTLVLPSGRSVALMRSMRILILDFFYSLREAYYKGERTLVLPSGRTVGLMRSMRILILERSERTLVLPSGRILILERSERSVALMRFFFISMRMDL